MQNNNAENKIRALELAGEIENALAPHLEGGSLEERQRKATIVVLSLDFVRFKIANREIQGSKPDYASQAERQK
jgi:hypothetical protein